MATVAVVCVLAWLVRTIARDALEKASQDDIPHVIVGLADLLRCASPFGSPRHPSPEREGPVQLEHGDSDPESNRRGA
jgi:hypothetical protein